MIQTQVNLVINKMTKAKYEELLALGQINDNELYYIIDDDGETLVKGYAQQVIDATLLDYVKKSELQGELSEILPVEANPANETASEMLNTVKIGSTVYTVNDITGNTMTFSTESSRGTEEVVEPTRGLLRSAPLLRSGESEPQEELILRTITIGNDNWIVGDTSEVEGDIEELQTTISETDSRVDSLERIVYAEDPATGNLVFPYVEVGNDLVKVII